MHLVVVVKVMVWVRACRLLYIFGNDMLGVVKFFFKWHVVNYGVLLVGSSLSNCFHVAFMLYGVALVQLSLDIDDIYWPSL